MLLASVLGNALAMADEEGDEVSLSGRLINIHHGDDSVREYDLASGTRRTIYQLKDKYYGLDSPIVKVGEESFIIRASREVPASEREGGSEAHASSNYERHMLLIEDEEAHSIGEGWAMAFFPKHGKLLYVPRHRAERLPYLYEAELAGRQLGPGRNVGIIVHSNSGEALMLSDDEVLVGWKGGTHSHARYNLRTGHVTGMSLDSSPAGHGVRKIIFPCGLCAARRLRAWEEVSILEFGGNQ